MSKWGKHVEFSEKELEATLDVVALEVLRQHYRRVIDPVLVNVLKKLSKKLHVFKGINFEGQNDSRNEG